MGIVFRLNPEGANFTVLHSFSSNFLATIGGHPGEPLQGADGIFYGLNLIEGGAVFRLNTNGGGTAMLKSLSSSSANERGHHAGLTQGSDGTLYGTLFAGYGDTNGIVFKINTNGSDYSVLHFFTADGLDGQHPDGRLVETADGWLYGTTVGGGTNGQGAVFRINTNGTDFAVLHDFDASKGDGE